jgi:hypothetical protein
MEVNTRGRTDDLKRNEKLGAFLALALSKIYGETLYIEIETVDNTPDTRLRTPDYIA